MRTALMTHGRSSLVEYRKGDAESVCSDLRESDVLDIAAATRLPAVAAVTLGSLRSRPCYTVLTEGRPIAVLGVEPSGGGEGSCWLIGSNAFATEMKSGLARMSKPWFEMLTRDYSKVFNYVPEANVGDLRWLDFLGFERGRIVDDYRGLGHRCVEVWRTIRCSAPIVAQRPVD